MYISFVVLWIFPIFFSSQKMGKFTFFCVKKKEKKFHIVLKMFPFLFFLSLQWKMWVMEDHLYFKIHSTDHARSHTVSKQKRTKKNEKNMNYFLPCPIIFSCLCWLYERIPTRKLDMLLVTEEKMGKFWWTNFSVFMQNQHVVCGRNFE